MAGPARPPVPIRPTYAATRRRRFRPLRYAIIALVWGTLAVAVMLLWFARDLPRPEAALDAARRPSLTLEDRSGHVFATFGDLVGEP
ncbi:MAG TPA: transpeptidase-transglycosylase, partial [Acetobacteraceae bacterium]|nr:transpeptidase-transglycosylase [Acetobacteraceae bacterium]